MRAPSWDDIAAYLAVRRTGSLSAAARALGLSQPTVRRQIETLEAAVGTPLFTRSASGLSPLDDAGDLAAAAEAMDAAARDFARRASAPAEAAAGVVRIAASAVFAVEVLPPILTGLRAERTGIDFELSVSNARDDLLRREADVAVRLIRPTQAALVARRVAPVALGLYVAPGPLADRVVGMDYAALAASGLMIGQDRDRSLVEGLAALALAAPDRWALRTDDDLAQLAAIRAGLGVGVTQARIARRSGLVRVLPELALALEAWVVMHEDQRRVGRIRIVFDALVAALAA